jgi:hypothetical protein
VVSAQHASEVAVNATTITRHAIVARIRDGGFLAGNSPISKSVFQLAGRRRKREKVWGGVVAIFAEVVVSWEGRIG